jgi:hypothetical protein
MHESYIDVHTCRLSLIQASCIHIHIRKHACMFYRKDWKSDCKLSHILMVIRCLLIEPNPESALNEEAGRMFMEDYEEYNRRYALCEYICVYVYIYMYIYTYNVHGGIQGVSQKVRPICFCTCIHMYMYMRVGACSCSWRTTRIIAEGTSH